MSGVISKQQNELVKVFGTLYFFTYLFICTSFA